MKFILSLFVLLISSSSNAQVLRSGGDYVPNQIIVKLKDSYSLQNAVLNQNKTGVSNLFDNFLVKNSIKNMSRVFSENGSMVKETRKMNLTLKFENTLVLTFKNELADVFKSIEELKKMPEVEYAEPNYYFSVDHTLREPSLAEINETKAAANKVAAANTYAVAPNDPLFSQQQNIQLANVQKAWEVTKGDSVVIGVLDTGVDWEHPDLQGNIWINYTEMDGRPGVDDDNNGYIDDIRGWDWINNDNNPTDDNSHGTHVAGIIAARGDNGIGITGVNWHGKIMCLKVMQSTGRGDAVTIARGVEYAAAMGAKVMNLSLGGYYESLALKASLEKAYAKSFIVAAAGNDGKLIGPCTTCGPLYPASYSFIMGVQDAVTYSNLDQDGAFISKYPDQLNYDIFSPGTSILSCVPKGGYKSYTGTSMSTPTVSGVVSLYKSLKVQLDNECLFGHLINTSATYVDCNELFTKKAKPNLNVVRYEIIDTCKSCDNDGRPDAGEEINLKIYLKNFWGEAEKVSLFLQYDDLADTSLVKIVEDSSYVGDIACNASSFTISRNKIIISEKAFDDADYKISVLLKDNLGNNWKKELVLTFQNAQEIGGIITQDLTLFPGKNYIVNDNVIVSDCVFKILPGSKLTFEKFKALKTLGFGKVIAIGTKDSIITFTSKSVWYGMNLFNSESIFDYCIIENMTSSINGGGFIAGGSFKHTLFRYNDIPESSLGISSTFNFVNIIENSMFSGNNLKFYGGNLNIINNKLIPYYENYGTNGGPTFGDLNNLGGNEFNIFNNYRFDLVVFNGSQIISLNQGIYLGTDDSLKLERIIFDFFDNPTATPVLKSGSRKIPCSSCPGVVWKLEIDDKLFNSYGSQPFDIIEPGIHKIKIYFNRAMDTTIVPEVTFGQKYPFNQIQFQDRGIWSIDSTAYTLARDFTIKDPKGIVTFRISSAKDDMGMEIPDEKTRFSINLQSTGSKSLNFGVQSLCGKIGLDWENLRTPGSDIIGYNLYRRKNLGNNTYSNFSLLNKELILDNNFVDYKVNLDTTYQYVYTAVRAGMNNETDSSFIVAGMPLASKLADANGDSAVNVLDVVAGVNYILQKDPAPFVFKQTDINNDGNINVLDIIGIIDRILNPRVGFVESSSKYDYNTLIDEGEVYLYKLGDTLFARSNTLISGIQSEGAIPQKWIGDASTWERLQTGASNKGWMVYGFGKSIDVNRDKPIALVKNNVDPAKWLFSSSSGRPIKVTFLGNAPNSIQSFSENVQVSSVYPNPSNGKFRIAFKFNTDVSGFNAQLYDKSGKLVQQKNLGSRTPGMFIEEFDIHNVSGGAYSIKFFWNDAEGKREMFKQLIKQ